MDRRTAIRNMLFTAAALATAPAIAVEPQGDAELLRLEEQIFTAHEAANEHREEIERLTEIWKAESFRFSTFTHDERWGIVRAMPECVESERLSALSQSHAERRDELIDQMWAIPATTPEGRRAKLLVALNCVLDSDWLVGDGDADWRVELTRKMLIEFVGGEPAKQLRDQFA